jgi:predicted nuclease with TOPRIM domain
MISLPPTASLAERIVALEETQRQQSDLIADVRDRIDKEVRVRASELESERRDREGEDNKIQGRLEEASAGGLHVERVGVFWLFLGLVFGTASTEIAKFFGG